MWNLCVTLLVFSAEMNTYKMNKFVSMFETYPFPPSPLLESIRSAKMKNDILQTLPSSSKKAMWDGPTAACFIGLLKAETKAGGACPYLLIFSANSFNLKKNIEIKKIIVLPWWRLCMFHYPKRSTLFCQTTLTFISLVTKSTSIPLVYKIFLAFAKLFSF